MHVGSLGSEARALLLPSMSNALYASGPNGVDHLLFVHEGTLLTQPLDSTGLRLTGTPTRVADHVRTNETGEFVARMSVSESGPLVFEAASPPALMPLLWLDRAGTQVGSVGLPGRYLNPSLSPDGMRVVVDRIDAVTRASLVARLCNLRHLWP